MSSMLDAGCLILEKSFTAENAESFCHRAHRVGFTGRGVDGLVYSNSQPYSKRACAFGLRSLSKLLTLSALVKPEKSLFFLERLATKRHKKTPGKVRHGYPLSLAQVYTNLTDKNHNNSVFLSKVEGAKNLQNI